MDVRIVHVDDLDEPPRTDAAIVIDVLRAFTVAPWCLARGAQTLLLAPTVDAAIAAGRRWPNAVLLKDGPMDERFLLPNAPGIVAESDLSGRVVIQKTGNGTRGAHAVAGTSTVLCASFVTAAATARALRHLDPATVTFVVTEGDEDVALADYLSALLRTGNADASPYLARAAASAAAAEIREQGPDESCPGVHPNDLWLSLQLDRFDFALRAEPAGDLLRIDRC
jgi:2-phosphosulfolactate phosphatase